MNSTTKINTAAITLFEQLGQDFTLDQLSQKAQTSRATLYRRIGSKQALLNSLNQQGLINLAQQSDIKTRVMSATQKVVAEHGFINCTMEQIAAEAGLGIATLYRHYAEKENLLRAFTTQIKAGVSANEFDLAADMSMEEGINSLVKTMLSFIHQNKDIVKILFFGNPNERKYISSIRDASTSTFKLIAKYLHQLQTQNQIRTDIKVEDLVASLMGQLIQFALTAPLNLNRELNIERDAKLITRVFCQGVKK
ncbi:MAG: helix-turn-helix transcriptional regulator [Alphaproteobacteria bacterium]|nr:helix-turn-helix transcriptional regulator [Alphaproteobacteria bacterium]